MLCLNFKKGIKKWVKSPWGLAVLLIGVVHQHMNWPAFFYIEDDYEKLKWVEVDGYKYNKSGGRYGSYSLIITGVDGDKYVFSNFGFDRNERKGLVNVLNKGDEIGWYSTCFPWKTVRVGGGFLSGNCAVVMEVSRDGNKYILFEDRVDSLKSYFFYVLFKIYWVFFLCLTVSLVVLMLLIKRN